MSEWGRCFLGCDLLITVQLRVELWDWLAGNILDERLLRKKIAFPCQTAIFAWIIPQEILHDVSRDPRSLFSALFFGFFAISPLREISAWALSLSEKAKKSCEKENTEHESGVWLNSNLSSLTRCCFLLWKNCSFRHIYLTDLIKIHFAAFGFTTILGLCTAVFFSPPMNDESRWAKDFLLTEWHGNESNFKSVNADATCYQSFCLTCLW